MGGLFRVFEMRGASGFEHPEDDPALRPFDGTLRSHEWRLPTLKMLKGSGLQPGDILESEHAFVLTSKAKAMLTNVLGGCGELLPAKVDGELRWLLNVVSVIDALDESKSRVLRSPRTGEVVFIDRPVFHPESLTNAVVFKVPQMREGLVFATETFVRSVNDAGLTGVLFDEVWSSGK